VVVVAEDVAVQPTATLPPPTRTDNDEPEQPVAGMAVAISLLALTVSTVALAAVAWEAT
jgi:hypothetical protein